MLKKLQIGFTTLIFLLVPTLASAEEIDVPTIPELITKSAEDAGLGVYDQILLKKIAFCESESQQFGKDGRLYRGWIDPDDIGVFQVNRRYHEDRMVELGYSIYKTQDNIDYAILLYKDQGSAPWNASRPCWNKQIASWSK